MDAPKQLSGLEATANISRRVRQLSDPSGSRRGRPSAVVNAAHGAPKSRGEGGV